MPSALDPEVADASVEALERLEAQYASQLTEEADNEIRQKFCGLLEWTQQKRAFRKAQAAEVEAEAAAAAAEEAQVVAADEAANAEAAAASKASKASKPRLTEVVLEPLLEALGDDLNGRGLQQRWPAYAEFVAGLVRANYQPDPTKMHTAVLAKLGQIKRARKERAAINETNEQE